MNDLSTTRQQRISSDIQKSMQHRNFDEGTAMAAIQLISAALFSGGTTDWEPLLVYATLYAKSVLRQQQQQQYYSQLPAPPLPLLLQALAGMTGTNRFLCKIAIWFDTLAAPSRKICQPQLLDVVSQMYHPSVYPSTSPSLLASLYTSASALDGIMDDSDSDSIYERISMMNVMGCDPRVVWALAQISTLLARQECGDITFEQDKEACREFVLRVLDNVAQEEVDIDNSFMAAYDNLDTKSVDRQRTSKIFRLAAYVYLHAVIDGSHPTSPRIKAAVAEAQDALLRAHGSDLDDGIQPQLSQRRTIYPSVVFAIFLCGALTDEEDQRQFFRECLQNDVTESHPYSGIKKNKRQVGNCAQVLRVLENIWADRIVGSSDPVLWRKHLLEENLLLV
jgi:C6 transcription factor Pro1